MRVQALAFFGLALAASGFVNVVACSSFDSSDTASLAEAGDACTTCGEGGGADAAGGDAGSDAAPYDPVVSIHSGGQFACALRGSKTVSCWGRNNEGEIAQTAANDTACDSPSRCRPTPLTVPGLTNVTNVSPGLLFGCARVADGSVLCWGDNSLGELGIGSSGSPRPSADVVPALPHALDVSAGAENACARVDEDGGVEVYCWGANHYGVNGQIPSASISGPTRIPSLSGAKSVVLSRVTQHGCAIMSDDRVMCWGINGAGSLGHSPGTDFACDSAKQCTHMPSYVGDATFKVAEIALGFAFGCGRTLGNGKVQCWGYNGAGSLGIGTAEAGDHPAPETPVVTGATAIAAGASHACAIVAGKLRCWGENALGELGNGYKSDPCGFFACKSTPQDVQNLAGTVTRVAAGLQTTYVSTSDGKEWALGANGEAQLGHPPGSSGDLADCGGKGYRCNPSIQPLLIP